jgi:hypothetical protein
MDRRLSQDGQNFQYRRIALDCKFVAGTAGAVPALNTFAFADGVLSVVKSTNAYIVTLQDGYIGLLNYDIQVLQASFSTSGACIGAITAEAVATGTPTVTVQCYTFAGAAVSLAVGDTIYISFDLKG